MESDLKEIEQLIAHSKKLREISRVKCDLEAALLELTLFNNVAELAKKPEIFSSEVLAVSCKVISNPIEHLSMPHCLETILISVQNLSEKFTFNSDYWQFLIRLNDGKTHCNWILEDSLRSGQRDTFCFPMKNIGCDNFNFQKVDVGLKFVFKFDSKTFTKSFHVTECIIDTLHCLDPGRRLSSIKLLTNNRTKQIIKISNLNCETQQVLFPPVTMCLLKLDLTLKSRFLKDILLRDSIHRGFECSNEELSSLSNLTVFFSGHKIELCLSLQTDTVTIKCANPAVLCAVKASILRRLGLISGITVEALDDKCREQLEDLRLKLATFQSDQGSDRGDVTELMEYYLELRDITESIRFSVVNVIE